LFVRLFIFHICYPPTTSHARVSAGPPPCALACVSRAPPDAILHRWMGADTPRVPASAREIHLTNGATHTCVRDRERERRPVVGSRQAGAARHSTFILCGYGHLDPSAHSLEAAPRRLPPLQPNRLRVRASHTVWRKSPQKHVPSPSRVQITRGVYSRNGPPSRRAMPAHLEPRETTRGTRGRLYVFRPRILLPRLPTVSSSVACGGELDLAARSWTSPPSSSFATSREGRAANSPSEIATS